MKASVLSHAENVGLSSFREDHVSNEELLERAGKIVDSARKNDSAAGIYGVLRIPAANVKAARSEGIDNKSVFCVYDFPDGGVESHVDVYQRVAEADEQTRAARRHWLFDAVGASFIPVTDFRDGLLLPLAPP